MAPGYPILPRTHLIPGHENFTVCQLPPALAVARRSVGGRASEPDTGVLSQACPQQLAQCLVFPQPCSAAGCRAQCWHGVGMLWGRGRGAEDVLIACNVCCEHGKCANTCVWCLCGARGPGMLGEGGLTQWDLCGSRSWGVGTDINPSAAAGLIQLGAEPPCRSGAWDC